LILSLNHPVTDEVSEDKQGEGRHDFLLLERVVVVKELPPLYALKYSS
jgi:hypothetical protein